MSLMEIGETMDIKQLKKIQKRFKKIGYTIINYQPVNGQYYFHMVETNNELSPIYTFISSIDDEDLEAFDKCFNEDGTPKEVNFDKLWENIAEDVGTNFLVQNYKLIKNVIVIGVKIVFHWELIKKQHIWLIT